MKSYEALFIFHDSLKSEDVQKLVTTTVCDEITGMNGVVKDTHLLGKRSFSRSINRRNAGQYARVDFSMDAIKVSDLQEKLKTNNDVLRCQIVCGCKKSINENIVDNSEKEADSNG
ncbi:30S ribosomal protein S6 [Verrucomicrobiota bacterium]